MTGLIMGMMMYGIYWDLMGLEGGWKDQFKLVGAGLLASIPGAFIGSLIQPPCITRKVEVIFSQILENISPEEFDTCVMLSLKIVVRNPENQFGRNKSLAEYIEITGQRTKSYQHIQHKPVSESVARSMANFFPLTVAINVKPA